MSRTKTQNTAVQKTGKKRRYKLSDFKGYLYLAPALIILVIFTLYPLVKAFIMSFMEDYNIINGSYEAINLQNYKDLFDDTVFLKALKNTTIYVIVVVPVSIILSLIIATLINDAAHGKAVFQTIYFLPYVTSTIAIGIVWSWIFNSNYGLLNYFLSFFGIEAIPWLNDPDYALWALIIFGIWKSLAFNILIFLSGLSTISQDIYQAARIDSTPRYRVFLKITVPQLRPIIVYAVLMGLINAFKVYNEVFALFQSTAGPANSAITIVYYVYDKFYNSGNYGVASAAAIVLFVIILALTLIERKATAEKEDNA